MPAGSSILERKSGTGQLHLLHILIFQQVGNIGMADSELFRSGIQLPQCVAEVPNLFDLGGSYIRSEMVMSKKLARRSIISILVFDWPFSMAQIVVFETPVAFARRSMDM